MKLGAEGDRHLQALHKNNRPRHLCAQTKRIENQLFCSTNPKPSACKEKKLLLARWSFLAGRNRHPQALNKKSAKSEHHLKHMFYLQCKLVFDESSLHLNLENQGKSRSAGLMTTVPAFYSRQVVFLNFSHYCFNQERNICLKERYWMVQCLHCILRPL
jgi:hypothetical protein